MRDKWLLTVDIFDVRVSYEVKNGDASLESSECNCDIDEEGCRHVALADSRVRAVFNETDDGERLAGIIKQAPSQWLGIVEEDEEVESSESPV